MSEEKEPQPVDAEFEPAREDVPLPPKVRTPWGGLFLTFIFAAFAGGGLGALLAWVMDQTPAETQTLELADISGLEARIQALETIEPATGFDPSELETRLTRLENAPAPDVADLIARLDALEAAPPAGTPTEPVDLSPLEERLDALESEQTRIDALANQALDGLGEAAGGVDPDVLNALNARLDALEAQEPDLVDLSSIDARIAALEAVEPAPVFDASELDARIAALENQPAETVDLSAIENRLIALETRQAQAESQDQTSDLSARTLAARSLALVALTEQARTEGSFEAERAALSRLWRGNDTLDQLAAFSRSGVPDIDALAQTYPRDAIEAAIGTNRVFFGLIEVRPSTGNETGPLARIALAAERLDDGDLAGAIVLTEQLDGEALEAAQAWLVTARARYSVDQSLAHLREALTRMAAEAGADPT